MKLVCTFISCPDTKRQERFGQRSNDCVTLEGLSTTSDRRVRCSEGDNTQTYNLKKESSNAWVRKHSSFDRGSIIPADLLTHLHHQIQVKRLP